MKLDKNTITDTTQEKIYRQTETYRNRLTETETDRYRGKERQTDRQIGSQKDRCATKNGRMDAQAVAGKR